MSNHVDPGVNSQRLPIGILSKANKLTDSDRADRFVSSVAELALCTSAEERERWLDDGGALGPDD